MLLEGVCKGSTRLQCHAEPAAAAKYLGRLGQAPPQILRFAQHDISHTSLSGERRDSASADSGLESPSDN